MSQMHQSGPQNRDRALLERRSSAWFALLLLAGAPLEATPAAADAVTLDDQIIVGSECIGVDCANGEAFGFDTLRLKENNLRIRFQDTSNSASFPSNDWMIVINDSSNGGANRFSVEDVDRSVAPFTILAGAPDAALHVSERGLGLGTDLPEHSVHVVVGDTPAVRLEQSAAQGWPAHAWDVGGNEGFFFVGDATNNTTPLRILPGSDDATLVIGPGGDVTVSGRVVEGSSRAIKQAFETLPADEVLDRISRLEVSRWQYRNDGSGARHIGPTAEDFHQAFGLGRDAEHIAPADVAGVAVLSVQALNRRVAEQADEIERLRGDNALMTERLARLESLLAEK